ncbi:molybdate ABC transporter substrate-binding protein [Planosporangium flavigriseum]|uniref:Molybdate-binding protein n=1 Tax=Planosporangium flavigriseum TaxID=373681 RepID=A0A8J3PMG7_9ACTN|nr:molybdate ABC transporter substrate-binding protein [Planosporangium flavigriseum]NJC67107.1 molybdate ABC transporter substrate-binding protein [Planosporangium flavigriseum]GIG75511.1 molybdate-binding protein [Planosporangium flavigriseum]
MRRLTALVALAILTVAGCGGRASDTPTGTVTVLAAASLTESFTQIGKDFEKANPGVRVRFSFGGSSTLAQQITSGAPADVFAAASPATMKQVTEAGLAAGPADTFARNQLVIAVPKGNPKRIVGLADLTRPGTKVALCAATVPCGATAATALGAAGVTVTPVTLERDVRAALAKVRLGEVDAALVYRTDARAAAAQVDGVEFPESTKAVNDYPIVALRTGPNPAGAKLFVAYAKSEAAAAVLTHDGFQRP